MPRSFFSRSETHSLTLLGRAALALDRGQPSEAAELAERYLRRYPEPERVERGAGLEVAVRAFTRLGDIERAEDALAQLRQISARSRTRPLLAAVASSEGTLAASQGDHDAARRSFEDALDLLAAGDARFEAARVRLDLAATLKALGAQGSGTAVQPVVMAEMDGGDQGSVGLPRRSSSPMKRVRRESGPRVGREPRQRQQDARRPRRRGAHRPTDAPWGEGDAGTLDRQRR